MSEFIDLTTEQNKRIMKTIREMDRKEIGSGVNSNKVLDFSSGTASSGIQTPTAENTSGFAFLDNLAGAGSSGASTTSTTESSYYGNSDSSGSSNVEIADIKVKIENIEYKLTELIAKLSLIEDKLK
jgi:hypothetical protein